VLGALHKESQERSLDARGLSRLLSEEGQKAKGLLPAGLSSLFARSAPAEIVPSHARRVTYAEKAFETHSYETPETAPMPAMAPPPLPTEIRRIQEARAPEVVAEPERRSSGLWWLLLPLALLGIFALMRMGKREPEPATRAPVVAAPRVTVPEVVEPRTTAPAVAPAVERPQVEVQPPAAVTPPPRPVAPAIPAPATMEGAPAVTAEPVTARVEPVVSVVHFATSSDDPLNRGVMRKVVATLTEHPDARVRVRGYADPRGDQAMNQALSEARANSVRAYLISHGVSADRIDMVGRGTEDQLDSDADSRRVELIVER
jgi:outer membrane protein OmpA-like peptidoglycan-associated protein